MTKAAAAKGCCSQNPRRWNWVTKIPGHRTVHMSACHAWSREWTGMGSVYCYTQFRDWMVVKCNLISGRVASLLLESVVIADGKAV